MTKQEFAQNYYNQKGFESIGITFDTDWTPEFILSELVDLVKDYNVKSTFFATNPSDVLLEAQKEGIIEIGLHPNFFENSSHGKTINEVMTTLKSWFPMAIGFRTHGLWQSSNMLRRMNKYGMYYDVNLLLYDHPNLEVFDTFYDVTRIPYNWSDASHLLENRPMKLDYLYLNKPGLKILDIHPMLWYLNSKSYDGYNNLKAKVPSLLNAKAQDITPFIDKVSGVRTIFIDLLELIKGHGIKSYFMSELYYNFSAKSQS